MKTEVLSAIGEDELRRPAAVNAALAANDRVKYAFSLLQMALAHADAPDQPAATLKRERIACGIDDPSLDGFVAAARRQGGRYLLPGVPKLLAGITDDMRAMAAPVIDAGGIDTGKHDFARRLDTLLAALPDPADEILEGAAVTAITQADTEARHDSLHRLVMDLHKQLNGLQVALAEETIDGAVAYGLAPADRPRVAAFMAGLNRTARLKFDHPGLGTTATRSRDRLVIQNDIGTTDAHVIVIHVEDLTISVTYTDVHPERLRFFQEMLAPRTPDWATSQGGQLGSETQFHLATGRFTTDDEASCRACLSFLGSRLVFLIDWNRARKQLRGFLPGQARLALLRWAAENDIGHRGFLALGGARLVYQAIEATAGSAMHFGDRLSDVLGLAEAETFLRFTFRAATEGLLAHQSTTLIRDRIHAELARHFSNEEGRLLRLAADHAGLVFELASLVRDGTLEIGDPGSHAEKHALKYAHRARRFEHDADRLVIDTREAVRRRPDHAAFAPLLETADDVADALEEAAFLLGLLPRAPKDAVIEPLQALATLLVDATQEWVKALLHAAHVQDPNAAEDADAFLTAIDRVAMLEHQVDDAERKLTKAAIRHARDFAELHVCTELATKLEAASDALLAASLILRDRVLGEVLGA
jgi:uncharacterized protein Yka (UPF0111/DUF47 family)